jgi:thiamine biosynthesis lipoprotein
MIYRKSFFAMGCNMLALQDGNSNQTAKRLEKVPQMFGKWEKNLSRFDAESELNLINKRTGQPVQVSQTMWDVLQIALKAFQMSNGLVTPTLLSALETAGYDRSFKLLAEKEQPGFDKRFASMSSALASSALAPISFDQIEMVPQTRTICLPEGMLLDLGGVAKGWAAHEAMRSLKSYGPVLINAGGDIAISGLQVNGDPWSVGIIDPFNPDQHVEMLYVGRCGVATSGRDYRRWQKNGIWQHHIIDPRTNQPAQSDIIASSIVAPTVWEAEAAAKVVLILGSDEGIAWLEAFPDMAGMVILESGEIIHSTRLKQFLRS